MNDASVIGMIAGLVVLVLFSAFFSATETAYTSFSQARMKSLAQTKKQAKLALELSQNYNKILSTILIGNNIVNIGAASLATIVFTHFWGDLGVTLSTVVMTVAVLIFGEISPKSIAKERPESFAMAAAVPLKIFTVIFIPLNFLFDLWKKLLIKVFRLKSEKPSITEEEFSIIVSDIKEEGVLNEIEHDLIQNTLRYDETRISAVMTKAENIVSADARDSAEKIKNMFIETNYSRVPVTKENDYIGILYRADFYEMLLEDKSDVTVILKQPLQFAPDTKISKAFKEMQKNMVHMALVVENGDTIGLVTMEDMLEELVGEIDDKYDE